MATVTCITPNCNTELAARQLRCPNCHAFRPRLSQLTARRDAETTDEQVADDALTDDAESAGAGGAAARGTTAASTTSAAPAGDGARGFDTDIDGVTSTAPGTYRCDHAAREPGAITCPTCGELLIEPRSTADAVRPFTAEPAEPAPMRSGGPPRPAAPPQRRTGRLSPFRRGGDRARTREQWRRWRLMSGLARLHRPMQWTWRVAVIGGLIFSQLGSDRSALWTPVLLWPLVGLALVLRAQHQAALFAPWELSAALAEQEGRVDRPDGRRHLDMPMSRSLERALRNGFSNAVFRAQVGALSALCLFVLWALGAAVFGGDSSGSLGAIGFLFALPTGLAVLSAGLFRTLHPDQPPPGELAIIDLRQRDRRTLRCATTVCATAIVPMAVGLLTIQMQGLPEVEPAGASLPVVLITLWLLGLWAPAAVAAFNVAVRGQWPQRRISLMWAARLAAVAVGAMAIGEVIAIVVLGAGSPFG